MRVRLMVGHLPLEQGIGVRVPDPQQKFEGGVDVVGWKNNNEVTLKLSTPKPSTSEQTFNLNSLPEYPKAQ
jgi:hypothetical protein